jgi:hypothetical protein
MLTEHRWHTRLTTGLADALQPPLLRRFGFQARLSRGVRGKLDSSRLHKYGMVWWKTSVYVH